MLREEVLKIKQRFEALYWVPWNENFQAPLKEWGDYWLKLDYSISNDTIDKAIQEGYPDGKGGKNYKMPSISEFNQLYREVEKVQKESQMFSNTAYCQVCDNLGYVPLEKDSHQYILYCTECHIGEKYKYDGRELKDHKPYRDWETHL